MILASFLLAPLEWAEALIEVFVEGYEALEGVMVEGFELMGGYFIYGGLTVVNGLSDAFQTLLTATLLLLPNLPTVEGPPEYVETLNWFFPLGTLVGVLSGMSIAYITFLALRYVFRKFGAL
jgi:hypothetical protein